MTKDEGKFYEGLFLGKFFGGGKKHESNNNGGCFSTILGLVIIAILIFIGVNYGIKGIITVLVIFLIVIPCIIGIIKGINKYRRETVEEAWTLFNQGNYTLALEKAEPLAEKNADAADLAGVLYYHGEGCDKNFEKAFRYFEMGHNKNYEAKTNYALMLLAGDGCTANLELGRKELLDAATIGQNTEAIMRLGEFQLSGQFGFEKNIEKGMRNLRVAADKGYPYAEFLVGYMQFTGNDGVPQDKEKGLALIETAANNGCADASEFLKTINQN